jgi:dihydrofolate synthase/folylpolyglutamate synthase
MLDNPEGYSDTVNYLYNLQRHGIKLGLENIKKITEILGKPHRAFRSIHIAGTNGKGSTATMIASILRDNGLKVGLFTSPHLVSFTERIRINGLPIPEQEVIRLTSFIRNAISGADIKPTFFEFVTAMAFYYFASEDVDWAVIEVGMGGRFDATNIIQPEISIITNIALEHKEFLGQTLSEIAFEKAGIIKDRIPVVTATQHPEALDVIERIAKKNSSELHIYGRDFEGKLTFMDERHIKFNYISSSSKRNGLCIPLSGRYQIYNAALAIRACEIMSQRGLHLSKDAIYNGISNLNLEGRLEWVSHMPPIIIDSAHNPDAAASLADAIEEIFQEKKIILIVGIMKDKEIEGILKPLIKISHKIIFTRPKGERAAPPLILKKCIKNIMKNRNPKAIFTTNTVAEAIRLAETLHRKDHIILVTGSFYTTGEVKELFGYQGVLSQLRE